MTQVPLEKYQGAVFCLLAFIFASIFCAGFFLSTGFGRQKSLKGRQVRSWIWATPAVMDAANRKRERGGDNDGSRDSRSYEPPPPPPQLESDDDNGTEPTQFDASMFDDDDAATVSVVDVPLALMQAERRCATMAANGAGRDGEEEPGGGDLSHTRGGGDGGASTRLRALLSSYGTVVDIFLYTAKHVAAAPLSLATPGQPLPPPIVTTTHWVEVTYADPANAAACVHLTSSTGLSCGTARLELSKGSKLWREYPIPMRNGRWQRDYRAQGGDDGYSAASKWVSESAMSFAEFQDIELPKMRRRPTDADADAGAASTAAAALVVLGLVTPSTDFDSEGISVTPYLLYQILRGDGFPVKIILLTNHGAPAAGGAANVSAGNSTRALIQFDHAASCEAVLERFGPGVTVRLEGTPGYLSVSVKRSTTERRLFASGGNTATSMVVVPQGILKLGPIFERRWALS